MYFSLKMLLPITALGFGDGHVRFGFGRLSFADGLEQLERYLARKKPYGG